MYEVQEVDGTIQVVTEVGRQPWVVYRGMTTAAAVTGARRISVGYAVLAASLLVVAGGLAWVLRRLAWRSSSAASRLRSSTTLPTSTMAAGA